MLKKDGFSAVGIWWSLKKSKNQKNFLNSISRKKMPHLSGICQVSVSFLLAEVWMDPPKALARPSFETNMVGLLAILSSPDAILEILSEIGLKIREIGDFF